MVYSRENLSKIFLRNDIRGIYGEVLNAPFGYDFGRSVARKFGKGSRIVLGSDNRSSSPELRAAIISGLRSEGSEVTDVGIVPTPAIYYICATEDYTAGIVITASHNPKEYNGIKVCDDTGASYSFANFFGEIMEDLMGTEPTLELTALPEVDRSPVEKYLDFLRTRLHSKPRLSVALEYGNGTTSLFSEVVTGEDLVELGETFDPSFSRILPDPAKEKSYVHLKRLFEDGNFDLGIIFDTDGDRVGFTDEKGRVISPDHVAMLLLDHLAKTVTPRLLIDVKMSKAIRDYGSSKGYTVDFTEVGHSKVHENLLHKDFHIAAELSCHYYFNIDYHGFDDGLYSAVVFLNIVKELKRKGRTLSQVVGELPKYHSSKEYRVRCPMSSHPKIIAEVESIATKRNAEIVDIDGVRCHLEDGWFLIRPSSTEELLSYRVEGTTEESMNRYLKLIEEVISAHIPE